MSAATELLRRPGFRRLLVGQTVSALGDWMGTIALLIYVRDITNSSTAVGGILVLRLFPATVAGPLAARATARLGRKEAMLAMDAVRAGMVVLLPLVNALWWIYLWAFFVEVGGLVFLPARDASIPDLAGEGADLGIANGAMLASSYGTIPFGAGLFGLVALLAHVLGTSLHGQFVIVFFIDAVTYLVSFAAIRRLPKHELDRSEESAAARLAQSRFLDALRLPIVRTVMPAVTTVAIGVGALFSLGVTFVQKVLHGSTTQFGVLVALFGVGAAGGLGLSAAWHAPKLYRVRMGTAALGGVIVFMSFAANLALAFVAAVLFGAAATTTLVAGMTILQDQLEGHGRDLAFTAFHVVIRAGLALAALGAGGAADQIRSVRWPFFGTLPPSRVVLLGAGVVILLGSLVIRERVRPKLAEMGEPVAATSHEHALPVRALARLGHGLGSFGHAVRRGWRANERTSR